MEVPPDPFTFPLGDFQNAPLQVPLLRDVSHDREDTVALHRNDARLHRAWK